MLLFFVVVFLVAVMVVVLASGLWLPSSGGGRPRPAHAVFGSHPGWRSRKVTTWSSRALTWLMSPTWPQWIGRPSLPGAGMSCNRSAIRSSRSRARNLALSLAGRDIGDLPNVVNPARKTRAAGDFRFFCDSYFPLTFHLPWSRDHLQVIARIEQAVLRGGLFAMAMPRGSGKSTISECA